MSEHLPCSPVAGLLCSKRQLSTLHIVGVLVMTLQELMTADKGAKFNENRSDPRK